MTSNLRSLALLLFLLAAKPTARRIGKRTPATESFFAATSTPSTIPDEDEPKENPRVALSLKISLGILAGLFALSIIFCAIRAAHRGRNEPKQGEDVGRPPRYGDDVAQQIAIEPPGRSGQELSGGSVRGLYEAGDEGRARDAHAPEERVRSWVMELDDRGREAPPGYDGRRE
jgi:hypothetical protein